MKTSILLPVTDVLEYISAQETFPNSEVFASDFLENTEEMFSSFQQHSSVLPVARFKEISRIPKFSS